MLKAWVEAGQDPSQFWGLTPRELNIVLDGSAERLKREHNDRAWLAWHGAALGRIKKFPKLDTLLIKGDRKPKRGKTIEEMISIAHAWTASVNRRK